MYESKLIKLTDNQAIHIAKIAYPEVDWVIKISLFPWKGIDLIEKDALEHKEKHSFQIDFREKEEDQRFRYYNDAYEQTIVSEEVKQKIYDYIKTI